MNNALLQTMFDNPSGSQLAGGVMMITLFTFVGVAAAAAFAYVARRVFLGRYEQIYWAVLLAAIAAFYIGFASWFEAAPDAWSTELSAIAVFCVVAAIGAFSRSALALGYLMHGIWDITHSLYGTLILGHAASDIPLGYGMFCLGFDVATAVYLFWWPKDWSQPARFRPAFWRHEVSPLHNVQPKSAPTATQGRTRNFTGAHAGRLLECTQ